MPHPEPPLAPEALRSFAVTQTSDPMDLDARSRVSSRLPSLSRSYKYRLSDRALVGRRFDGTICTLASRESGSILVSYGADRFATEVSIDGDARDPLIITNMLRGAVKLVQDTDVAIASPSQGLVFRTRPGTRLLTSDDNARVNVFVRVAELEKALERLNGERLRQPLAFAPVVDWATGLGASLKSLMDLVVQEFRRPDGITGNPVALASLTDLLVSLVLRAIPHNHADRMAVPGSGAAPVYVRRAEEFMRANAAVPTRMANVAEAAGCSVSTLAAVFRRFRSTTPLRALHGIRLEQAHRELRLGVGGTGVAAVAGRYGFTNVGRFTAAYRRRFGETPADTARRALPPR